VVLFGNTRGLDGREGPEQMREKLWRDVVNAYSAFTQLLIRNFCGAAAMCWQPLHCPPCPAPTHLRLHTRPAYLSGVCFRRTSAYSAFTQLLTLSFCGAAAMCWQHAAHHCALTGPGSLERDSSSREMRRGLPPGNTAMDALHSEGSMQTSEERSGCHNRVGVRSVRRYL
jgi:hypothetical protein